MMEESSEGPWKASVINVETQCIRGEMAPEEHKNACRGFNDDSDRCPGGVWLYLLACGGMGCPKTRGSTAKEVRWVLFLPERHRDSLESRSFGNWLAIMPSASSKGR